MLFDNIENHGKNNRIDYMPDQYYGGYTKEAAHRIGDKIGKMTGYNIYSYYRGNGSKHFWGGLEVQKLEKAFEKYLGDGVKCLAVNSCTSALIIACGAVGIEPGDEVIVSPWSMSCSATAPMHYGGIPVFTDIEDQYFCLDPDDIERKITEKTKAIIAVDLFGQPADYETIYEKIGNKKIDRIMKIVDQNNIYIIEDAAQAIGSFNLRRGKEAGTFGHIGCFSFTQGKHMTAGEGGMIVTRNKELYAKCALLRNHAEAVMNDLDSEFENDTIHPVGQYSNLIGFNMRMTEIQAVILQEQLKYLDDIVKLRKRNVRLLMKNMPSTISLYPTRKGYSHSFYVMPLKYTGKDIKRFVDLVKRNLKPERNRVDRGVPIGAGYIKPLYKFPCFQGTNMHWAIKERDYSRVSCPNAERLNGELIICLLHGLDLSEQDIKDICYAFQKADEIVNGGL
jgi:dTDP-4-amino-4,6-dideoxygalactose transaminase